MNRNLMLAVATVLVLIAVPLAGCVGGSGQSAPSADDAEDAVDDATNTTEGTSDDLKAHVHDRWDGQEVVSVVDREITIEPVSEEHPSVVQQCRQVPGQEGPVLCLGSATFFPDGDGETGEIVPPGTERVEVSLDFDDGFDQIRFYYQDRMSQGQWNQLGTYEEPGTKTIDPIPVVRSDDGHAKVSAWKFRMEPKANPYAADDKVWYGEGTVTVTIEAHRQEGDLPLEPAHPDFWEETSTYEIGQVDGEAAGLVQVNRIHAEDNTCGPGIAGNCAPVQFNSQGLMWTVAPGYEGRRLQNAERTPELSGEHTRALVPPESQTLAAHIQLDGSTQAPVEVCLRAMTSPDQGPYGEVVECTEYSGGGQSWTVERAISEREVDSFYTDNTGQNASRWTFLLQVRAPKAAADQSSIGAFDGTVSMSVFVTEGASFSLPSWAGDGS